MLEDLHLKNVKSLDDFKMSQHLLGIRWNGYNNRVLAYHVFVW